jgi:transposase-like protein
VINTRKIAQEYRLTHWTQIMRKRTESGLSIKDYCEQIGICTNTYFYWQRRLREAACEELALTVNTPEGEIRQLPVVNFAEVTVKEPIPVPESPEIEARSKSDIHIELHGVQITVGAGYPAEKLAALLRELTRPC